MKDCEDNAIRTSSQESSIHFGSLGTAVRNTLGNYIPTQASKVSPSDLSEEKDLSDDSDNPDEDDYEKKNGWFRVEGHVGLEIVGQV